MSIKDINWAQEHDWYYYAATRATDGVRVVVTTTGDTFDNLEDLALWAGY